MKKKLYRQKVAWMIITWNLKDVALLITRGYLKEVKHYFYKTKLNDAKFKVSYKWR